MILALHSADFQPLHIRGRMDRGFGCGQMAVSLIPRAKPQEAGVRQVIVDGLENIGIIDGVSIFKISDVLNELG